MAIGIYEHKLNQGFQTGHKINLGKKRTKENIFNWLNSRKNNGEFWHNDATKVKISQTLKGKYPKEKNPNWKGGTSFEPYSQDWTDILKDAIRQRDECICQKCGRTQQKELNLLHQKLAVHHIDYNKKNCNPSNLITLCRDCNIKVNSNRNYWIKYFRNHYGKFCNTTRNP